MTLTPPEGPIWRLPAVPPMMTASVMVSGRFPSVGQGTGMMLTWLPIVVVIVEQAETGPVGLTASLVITMAGVPVDSDADEAAEDEDVNLAEASSEADDNCLLNGGFPTGAFLARSIFKFGAARHIDPAQAKNVEMLNDCIIERRILNYCRLGLWMDRALGLDSGVPIQGQ